MKARSKEGILLALLTVVSLGAIVVIFVISLRVGDWWVDSRIEKYHDARRLNKP